MIGGLLVMLGGFLVVLGWLGSDVPQLGALP